MSQDNQIQDRVFGVISKIFNFPVGKITPASSPETIANWDSLKHMQFVLALEQEFQIRFSSGDIGELNSAEKIIEKIQKYAPSSRA